MQKNVERFYVDNQARSSKRRKIESKQTDACVGTETELLTQSTKKEVRDQGMQTSASMEFRHPDFAWYNS